MVLPVHLAIRFLSFFCHDQLPIALPTSVAFALLRRTCKERAVLSWRQWSSMTPWSHKLFVRRPCQRSGKRFSTIVLFGVSGKNQKASILHNEDLFICVFPVILRFLLRHADADLLNLISTSVPPCDLSKISILQSHLSQYTGQAGSSC